MQSTLEPYAIATSDFCSLRITGQYILQEVFNYFAQKYNFVLVSEEGGDELTLVHFHLIIGGPDGSLGRGYQNVRNYVLVRYPELAGNSNKYCIKKVEKDTFKTSMCYTMKDGKFLYKNFSEGLINKFKRIAYKKFDKQVFAKALESLRIQFIENDCSILTGVSMINKLKTEYNQIPNETNTKNLIKLWYLQQSPSHQDNYDRNIATKVCMELGLDYGF